MVAGQLVAAEHAQDEQRLLVERPGQRGQQLQRGLVGPLQVVQQQRGGAPRVSWIVRGAE